MVKRLVLWDVDGTLVRAGDVAAAVFDQAVEDVVGRQPPERVRMSGKTDPLIVREYMEMMGEAARPDLDEVMAAVLDRLVARLAAPEAREAMIASGRACPGVADVLGALAAEGGVLSSLLTGNMRANAEVKVTAFGLDTWLDFEVGAYGSDDEDRNLLVPIALGRLARRTGNLLPANEVWVVGDTPRDLACARAAGTRCLLVATGRYTFDELKGLGADAAFEDLADVDAVLDYLAGA